MTAPPVRDELVDLFSPAPGGRCPSAGCGRPLAPGDPVACSACRELVGGPPGIVLRPTPAPRAALLAAAERHGWASLQLSRAIRVVGSEVGWRTFVRSATPVQVEQAVAATRETWGEFVEAIPAPGSDDDVFEAWRDEQTDRHLSASLPRGAR